MPKHDQRIDAKIAGPSWNRIRDQLMEVHGVLLSVDEPVSSELTTIYIKYKIADDPFAPVFAVLWVKSVKDVILGLATPEKIGHDRVTDAPKGMKYKGLTSYLKIGEDATIPRQLAEWAQTAYHNTRRQRDQDKGKGN
jgi:hypothetical protein